VSVQYLRISLHQLWLLGGLYTGTLNLPTHLHSECSVEQLIFNYYKGDYYCASSHGVNSRDDLSHWLLHVCVYLLIRLHVELLHTINARPVTYVVEVSGHSLVCLLHQPVNLVDSIIFMPE